MIVYPAKICYGCSVKFNSPRLCSMVVQKISYKAYRRLCGMLQLGIISCMHRGSCVTHYRVSTLNQSGDTAIRYISRSTNSDTHWMENLFAPLFHGWSQVNRVRLPWPDSMHKLFLAFLEQHGPLWSVLLKRKQFVQHFRYPLLLGEHSVCVDSARPRIGFRLRGWGRREWPSMSRNWNMGSLCSSIYLGLPCSKTTLVQESWAYLTRCSVSNIVLCWQAWNIEKLNSLPAISRHPLRSQSRWWNEDRLSSKRTFVFMLCSETNQRGGVIVWGFKDAHELVSSCI